MFVKKTNRWCHSTVFATCLCVGLLVPLTMVAPDAAATTLAEVQQRGELIMLCWPHQQSAFVRRMVKEYGQEGLNRFTGVDVEILERYAKSIGVGLKVVPMKNSFSELIPMLLASEGDIIGSSLTITQSRSKIVQFSRPYHNVKKVVVARKGSHLRTTADLDGHTAAIVPGSSHEEGLKALGLDIKFEPAGFILEGYTAVADGEADFSLVDSGSAVRVLKTQADLGSKLEQMFVFPQDDEYGFALAPDSDLKASLDAFLVELKESGELDRIKTRQDEHVYTGD